MWRNETKADIKAREAKLLQKQQEEWNRHHAPKVPQKTLHEILHPNRASEEYQRKLELRAAEERFREREAQEEEARKAELERQLKLAEKSETSITASELYENGLEARSSHQGIEAATLFWQSLICGESRAAYPLFEMLWNGESGVGKNHEMAAVILHVGKKFINQDCVAVRGIKNPHDDLSSEIKIACNKVKKILPENITVDVINAQESIISALMDQCILKTRQDEEPMTSVFAHPDVEEVQVEVSGDNDSSSNKCVLM